MINVLLSGANGRMGRTVTEDVSRLNDIRICAGVDINPEAAQLPFPIYTSLNDVTENVDVIIDFSIHTTLNSLIDYCKAKNIGVVLATTGYTSDEKELIYNASASIPIFYSANMSLGVNLQILLAKKAAEVLKDNFDIEIIETHHNKKADAPSGTALMIVENINDVFDEKKEVLFGRHGNPQSRRSEICVHAVRGGSIVGEHNILFLGPDEALEIKHNAYSKQVFSHGAIKAAKFLYGKAPGLYDMNDLLAQILNTDGQKN